MGSAERYGCRKKSEPKNIREALRPGPTEQGDRCADSNAELIGGSKTDSAGRVWIVLPALLPNEWPGGRLADDRPVQDQA